MGTCQASSVGSSTQVNRQRRFPSSVQYGKMAPEANLTSGLSRPVFKRAHLRTISRRILATVIVLVVGLATSAESAALSASGKVHDLSAKSFAEAVKGSPWLFVEFYAPWCGHCQKLAPIWEKTAQLAKELQLPIAKVDAIAEKALAEEQQVQSFPTLKLYRGSKKISSLYNGPREADKMIQWLRTWQKGPLLETLGQASAASARSFADKNMLAVLGVSSGDANRDAGLKEVLEAASFMLNPQKPGSEIPVGEVEATEGNDLLQLAPELSAPPAIVLFRKFDFEEKILVYRPSSGGTWKAESFMKWIEEKRVPALIPATSETEKYFLHNIDPGNGLVIYFGNDKSAAKTLHKIAVDYLSRERRLRWVQAAEPKFAEGLGKTVGVENADFPELCIWEFGDTEDDDKVFRLSQQNEDGLRFEALAKDKLERTVHDFVTRWQKKELTVEKDPVLSITSDTFAKYVLDNSRDVLVEFYAPWCQHCKSLAPEYKLVALHYAADRGIRISKMDATKHTVESVKITSYPTVKLFPREAKESPIDLAFKANQKKQNIIDFVEEHRSSGKSNAKKQKKKDSSKAQKTATQQATPSAQQPLGKHTGAPVDAGESGVWVFDDSMQLEMRGQALSADMVASKGGHTLVRVGSIGVLITSGNPSVAHAVRRFDSLESAKHHMQDALIVKAPPKAGALPCPEVPGVKTCEAWCAGVAAKPSIKFKAVVSGTPCSTGTSKHDPACTCYDESHTSVQAMCASPCLESAPGASGTCAAGDASCGAATASSAQPTAVEASPGMRFLLYDTKYGEGFNLQREVYPRAGWQVAQMNQALQKKCGAKTSGACARWTLVLPPWCRVVHWWSSPELVPWREFFDSKILRTSKVPVIEFEEYVATVGGSRVDLALVYTVEEVSGKTTGGKGEFKGWAADLNDCASKHRQLPQHEFLDSKKGSAKLVYSGHCDGGIVAKSMRCAVFKSPWPQATTEMLSTLDHSVGSVLLKGYDYLLAPENDQLDELGLRESMFFSEEIRSNAEKFIASKLGGGPYISAHCRRTDFLRVRTKTTPGADSVADKLNAVLEKQKIDKVFIATDAPDDIRADLKKMVKGQVSFFDEAGTTFDHPGKQAAAEMWIAARSDFFIGTQESRFTMHIQLERGFLGKPKETSTQEFCKTFEKGGKPCTAPHYRHPELKGKGREAYQ